MRNSATNKIEDGMVIVDPASPMADIVKFVSFVQVRVSQLVSVEEDTHSCALRKLNT